MKQKNFRIMFWLTVCIVAFGGLVFGDNTITVEATGEYCRIFAFAERDGENEIAKKGKYYFKYNYNDQSVSMSTKKNSGYEKTPMSYNCFANQKQAYYIKRNVLYKYEFASRKETKLKKIKTTGDEYYYISMIYGKQIYVTMDSFDQWKFNTYLYNVSTGKWKKVQEDCAIRVRRGNNVLADKDYQTDVSAHPLKLFKISGNGLKKVKTLSQYALGYNVINGTIYYTVYTDSSMKTGSLYRCKIDGTKAKKIFNFSTEEQYGQVYILNITAKNCSFMKDGKEYVYTYATKKTVEKKK